MIVSHCESCKRQQHPIDGKAIWQREPGALTLRAARVLILSLIRRKGNSILFKSPLEMEQVPFSFVSFRIPNTEYVWNCLHTRLTPETEGMDKEEGWKTSFYLAAKTLTCCWRIWRETWNDQNLLPVTRQPLVGGCPVYPCALRGGRAEKQRGARGGNTLYSHEGRIATGTGERLLPRGDRLVVPKPYLF